ncbi:hypothetical protein ABPG75_007445 [Micractinium tetrahymenae]
MKPLVQEEQPEGVHAQAQRAEQLQQGTQQAAAPAALPPPTPVPGSSGIWDEHDGYFMAAVEGFPGPTADQTEQWEFSCPTQASAGQELELVQLLHDQTVISRELHFAGEGAEGGLEARLAGLLNRPFSFYQGTGLVGLLRRESVNQVWERLKKEAVQLPDCEYVGRRSIENFRPPYACRMPLPRGTPRALRARRWRVEMGHFRLLAQAMLARDICLSWMWMNGLGEQGSVQEAPAG